MAGTIIADTLTHSTAGSVTTDYVVNGSAKAWSQFTTTTSTASYDDFNISSYTDNATGDTTLTFTSNMNNALYCHPASSGGVSSGNGVLYSLDQSTARTSSLFRVITFANSSGTSQDTPRNEVAVFGDLA
jgi:hypothetical protein